MGTVLCLAAEVTVPSVAHMAGRHPTCLAAEATVPSMAPMAGRHPKYHVQAACWTQTRQENSPPKKVARVARQDLLRQCRGGPQCRLLQHLPQDSLPNSAGTGEPEKQLSRQLGVA